MTTLTTHNDPIAEKARSEAIRNSGDYAPSSYKQGFEDGARWMMKQLQQNKS